MSQTPKVAKFEWAEGAKLGNKNSPDADVVGKHLDLLRKQAQGELTPVDVLKDAKNNNSPLHSFFQWDDTKAAHEYRLQQARGLIRAVVAVYVSEDRPAKRMRAFVHIPDPGASHYRATDHAMSQTRTRDLVLQQAWREFQAWRRRYQELDAFAALFAAADEIEKQLPKE